MKVKIYVLKDPRTNIVRYVGATVNSLNSRLSNHIWDAKNLKGTRKINWIRQLLSLNLKPIIEVIEETEDWMNREKYWYDYYKNRVELVNTNDGGQGVFKKDSNSVKRSSESKFIPIIQYSIDGKIIQEWKSIKEATINYGYSRNAIKNNLRGLSASCGGFIWKYKSKNTPQSNRTPIPKNKHKQK